MRNRRDIYLRAHTELHREQETKPRKRKDKAQLDKWPKKCLSFDTETRTCMEAGCNGVRYQQLMFGIYRVCKLVEGRYICESEGIFYSSSEEDSASSPLAVLEKSELNAIGTFVLNNFADIEVKQFPPKLRLAVHQSYPEFMNKVFWPAVRKGYLIVGFNLPFDLSRLSLRWNEHRKGGFSLIMSLWFNPKTQRWEPHSFRPTIHIRPKDAKTSFISRSSIRKKHARKEWPNPGRFLDLYTLLYSLFDMHMGLDVWCSYFRKKGYEIIHRTVLHEPRGRVEKDELIQCREDVKRTHQLLNAAMQEFNIHSLPSLSPDRSYSPAVIAKGYMREMRIELPKIKFKETVTNEINGIAMQTYYGGRSEVHIRRIAVPVMRLDFTSCYCTVNTLLRNWDVLTADSVEFPVCTDEIRDSLNSITLDKCFDLALWPQLRFFALIEPDHDIFPIRAAYNERDKDKFNIGLNYLTSKQPVWFSGPDIIASILLNKGKVPKILKAFRLVPSEKKQEGLKLVQLLGEVHIDPCVDDFYKFTVEQKQATKDETLKKGLKCIGNAGAYGPLVQLNRDLVQFRRYDKKTGQKISLNPKLDVYSGEHFHQQNAPKEIEVSGPFYFPPVAALITAGSRLLLALAERCVEDAGGQMVFCDTDSLCIVSNDKGGRVPASCNDFGYTEGADPREFDPIPCLKRETVIAISKRFEFLNPYSFKGTILKVEDVNFVPDKDGKPTSEFRDLYAYAISAKRYVLFEGRHVRNIVDATAHGIGYLMSPIKSENDSDRFVMEFWQKVLENEGVSYKSTNPKWLDLPA